MPKFLLACELAGFACVVMAAFLAGLAAWGLTAAFASGLAVLGVVLLASANAPALDRPKAKDEPE